MNHVMMSAITALILGSYPAAAESCGPVDGAEFLCGVDNVEDFVQLPNGQMIGGDLAEPGKQGFFFLFNPDRSARPIKPEEIAVAPDAAFAQCPGAPDWKTFGPHGLDVSVTGNKGVLYAVNHGGREAIEIFGMDLSGQDPKLTWTGCLLTPKGTWPDDVAALPGGGLAVTSLWDPKTVDGLKN
ncbi:hypothetical protein ECB98_23810 [Brucellaceae bacterium VT-16-1752]|nr:hypothetical protein ECB98_23810 [Brucellaceae bacterium VT-16-1752]